MVAFSEESWLAIPALWMIRGTVELGNMLPYLGPLGATSAVGSLPSIGDPGAPLRSPGGGAPRVTELDSIGTSAEHLG